MTSRLTEGLNPQQLAAVTAGEGPVLVLAGPGSGKTRVLTHRIAYLIQERLIAPNQIVAVTFTNKAAREMRDRVEKLMDSSLHGFQIGTFHSICGRLLRRETDHIPYGRDYVIFDTDDQLVVLKKVLDELNLDPKKYPPSSILRGISDAKNRMISFLEYVPSSYAEEPVSRCYGRYQELLVANNAMDFDDIIMQTTLLLRDNEVVRDKYQNFYEHVLVDEFQDTNLAQYELVQLLGLPQKNVFVVGDEDQGIYSFRGADHRNVQVFVKDFPEAKIILLEQNYRSTKVILDAARSIIDKNPFRIPKALFTDNKIGRKMIYYEAYDEDDEARYVASKVKDIAGKEKRPYSDFAVMYRTNLQSRVLEDAFNKSGIPNRLVGGTRFFSRKEVKDLIAYLRLINNVDDTVSFNRVINFPRRGIGKKTLDSFWAWLNAEHLKLPQGLDTLSSGSKSSTLGSKAKIFAEFNLLLQKWRRTLQNSSLSELLSQVIEDTQYIKEISDGSDEAEEKLINIADLQQQLKAKDTMSLSDYLAEVSLIADVDKLEESADAVTLLTLHAAKGLEFKIVFIIGMEDGILPYSRPQDELSDNSAEERRLMYVGLTRAREQAYLVSAFKRSNFYKRETDGGLIKTPTKLSPFVLDIPLHLLEGFSPSSQNLHDRQGYKSATLWDNNSTSYSRALPQSKQPNLSTSVKPLRFKINMRVLHPEYGEGRVLKSRAVGNDDEDVEVIFENKKYGFKTLSANHARLRIIRD